MKNHTPRSLAVSPLMLTKRTISKRHLQSYGRYFRQPECEVIPGAWRTRKVVYPCRNKSDEHPASSPCVECAKRHIYDKVGNNHISSNRPFRQPGLRSKTHVRIKYVFRTSIRIHLHMFLILIKQGISGVKNKRVCVHGSDNLHLQSCFFFLRANV